MSVSGVFATIVLSVSAVAAEGLPPVDPKVEAAYEAMTFQSVDGILPYRLLRPAEMKPGETYPLVLFLHGSGERGDDNVEQLRHGAREFLRAERREAYPCFVLVPQCPRGETNDEGLPLPDQFNNRWVQATWKNDSGDGTFAEAPNATMAMVLELVDDLTDRLPIDPDHRVVTGLSMGGMGTWFAAAAKPARFSRAMVVCGGGDPSWAGRYTGIPIWVLHGRQDRAVDVDRGREMVTALTAAGHYPEVRYTEYPAGGHDVWTRTYAREDVFEFLLGTEN